MICRKKPVEVEVFELTHENIASAIKFMYGDDSVDLRCKMAEDYWERYVDICEGDGGIKIKTLEGVMLASFGDYIIKGVNGEFYPCKPDIFIKTYDIISE